MQDNITVDDGKITGTLMFIEGGLSPSGPLAGDGHFLALKWSDPDDGVTSLKVGLRPSASGMDLIECIDDTDRNGVFKISDTAQKFIIEQFDGDHINVQEFDLSELVLEDSGA